ncbi:Serine/threonine-protein kinase PrkC [Legionella busanensis]|uniref:Serine/threonine-protein kinase PrkC n=1 Tax=Legionella busanensis TaxID=190655 RepID=A0A378JNF4_9GAMM|nr:serine/threonine-protein kinase [Legionella busanensis]STX52785.1 Serine/threonine-protein kinase PrkC [Legionella busanensis]
MVKVSIDPTKLTSEHSAVLGKLLSEAELGRYFSTSNVYAVTVNGIAYRVKLKYPIYKENEKTSRVLIKEIGSGGEAKVYFAETVTIDAKEMATFKSDPQHPRVVKVHRPEEVVVFRCWETEEEVRKETAIKKYKSIAEVIKIYNPLHTKGSVVYELSSQDKEYFYNNIMHQVAGRTLADILTESKKLTPELRFAISRKLLEAIKELHDRGIIHTDIKPPNIMIDIDFQTNTIRSLKLIDLDTAEAKNTGIAAKTRQYESPQKIAKNNPEKIDLYAAAISLLEVWGVPRDKVQTPPDYDNKRKNFKAQTQIDNLEPEEIRKGLERIFEEMTNNKSSEFIDSILLSILNLDQKYQIQKFQLSPATTDLIATTRKIGEQVKICFRKTISTPNDVESLKKEILAILKDNNDPFSAYELGNAIDSQALQQCLSPSEVKDFISLQLDLLKVSLKKLDTLEAAEQNKLLKKLIRIHTLDEIVAFNAKYTDRIQYKELYLPHDKEKFKDNILKYINNVDDYNSLQRVFHSIKNNEKFLKSERGSLMQTFGQYGATTTWVNIMQAFESKAFEIAAQELRWKMEKYQGLSNPEQFSFVKDQFRRRYLPFFSEQTGRIFQHSDLIEKFNRMLDDTLKKDKDFDFGPLTTLHQKN